MFNVSSIDVASTSNETVGASSSTPVLNVSDTSDQLTMFSTAYVSILSFLSDYSLHVMSAAAVVILTTFLASQIRQRYRQHRSPITETVAKKDGKFVPESVNYHMTRRCNYRCGFCFHTAKTSTELPLDEAKRGLQMLRDAGMIKVNFSGGEPFLPGSGSFLGKLVKFCKQELKLESVSVVTNGSLVREKWFRKYGEYLDIMAVSCDSFDPQTNAEIGRQQNQRSDHLASLMKVRDWCGEHKVAFKINTVVNTFNKDEDMTESIQQLRPVRWKVFQCLVIDGENAGPDALRNAERFVITDEEFENFLVRHSSVKQLVPESNEAMRYSYLIVDECMRFLDGGTKRPSLSILDVGVENAIDTANFDEKMFLKRGGKYTWSKADMKLDW